MADLEAYDPHPRTAGAEQRYLCPLAACRAHSNPTRHRSLSANLDTGLWHCHRCGDGGQLREYWRERFRPRPARLRLVGPPAQPQAPKPAIVAKQRVGGVRRWACQDASGTIRGVQCRQDVLLTLADGTEKADKDPWWELPDGRPSQGQIHAAELAYCTTPLPEIPDGADVLIVEGPPKADAGARLGVPYVVALVCGAGNTPSAAILDQLARFRCILTPDNDDTGHALMRRTAAGLLERGAAPRWLALPVGPKGDLVDYERDGATPEDLAARIAAAPAAYTEVVAALRAELATDGDGAQAAALQVALDQAEAKLSELKHDYRALLQEHAECARQTPRAFIQRVVPQVAAMEAHKKTRGIAVPMMVLLAERQEQVEAGKPAETPIPWRAAEREAQFGRDADTLRKALDRLEEYGFVDRTYEWLGEPESGDHRQTLLLSFTSDVPLDLPDALNIAHRRMTTQEPLRVRPKRSKGCAPCRSPRCEIHPDSPVDKWVRHTCHECGGLAAPDHIHAPQRPSRVPPQAVMHVRPTPAAFPDRPNFSVESSRDNVAPKFSVEAPPPADLFERAQATADAIAAELGAAALPPAEGIPLQLAILRECARRLRAGEPPPTPTDACDSCGATLRASEFLRCEQCAHAEVA